MVVVASVASLMYSVSYWYSQVLDFPRLQYLILGAVCLLLFVLLNRRWTWGGGALVLGLISALAIQVSHMAPYYHGEPMVPSVSVSEADPDNSVGILLANVLQPNERADDLLQIVRDRNPDIVLAMEVDDRWANKLSPLKQNYTHTRIFPASNGYGMALYSKLPLSDEETMFFNIDSVPSMHASVELPSGRTFMFHGVHPLAPVPSSKYPDATGKKEVALGKVAEMVAGHDEPAIVAGDFNDVSWSHTSRMFESRGDLRNARLGRGLYNSFDAKSWFMRWPLDHYFVTEEFGLLEMERLPEFGSDHFPMYARFVLR